MPLLVGRRAPDFVAPGVLASGVMVNRIHLHTAIQGRYALLFFNPLALTYACASQLPALSRRIREFWSRDVEVLGVTLDAAHQHSIWRNVAVDHLPKLSFSLVVDTRRCICPDYGLAIAGGAFAHRGIFLIDLCGVVRYQAINDLPLGSESIMPCEWSMYCRLRTTRALGRPLSLRFLAVTVALVRPGQCTG